MNAITLIFIYLKILVPVKIVSVPNNNCLNRLAAFPKPDFSTNFTLRSQRGLKSFKEIHHGLGKEPFYVRVYAQPKTGANQGFCFNGIGVNQVDSSHTSYGGLIYAYNSDYIRVWAPSQASGHIIFIKDGWGGGRHSQQTDEALVVVEIWASGPEPNFQIDTVIGNGTKRGSFGEVDHRLRQIPDRVLVQVSPENTVNSKGNPNGGYWFHAVSFSQNSNPNGSYGGVIFAYNERIIRLWAPDTGINNTGCILIDRGWGGGAYSQLETRCRIHVKVWVNMLPVPSFQTDWFDFKAQRGLNSFKEIHHNLNSLPALIIVQVQALRGMNYHFTFEGQGSIQSNDNSDNGYGGITFAYNNKIVRLWAPSQNDNSKKGYALLIRKGWGNNRFLQEGAIEARVRVLVYGSKCTPTIETTFTNNTCIQTNHETYFWLTSSWSKCSSICNQGQRQRDSTGCKVTSKKLMPEGSCDFEQGMCRWKTTSLTKIQMNWKRTNGTTNKLNSGPMWGYPRGSYYVYTNSDGVVPLGKGSLESPSIPGPSRCHLSFYWNMYGADIGDFSVEVSTARWGDWKDTGWKMTGSQGPIYWRPAYLDLEQYAKVYGIRFLHILPERPSSCNKCPNCAECKVCPGGTCNLANVAIDDIQLWCEASSNVTAASLCKSKTAPQTGCEQTAIIKSPQLKGPAYSEEVVTYALRSGSATFVKAVGARNDIIGIYHVHVYYPAQYCLWMSIYNTNESNNAVSFKIDDGDWHEFSTAKKIAHHLWINYRYKVFLLMPGDHTLTFRQAKRHFRFDKIVLSPVTLPTWVDLGMESHLIPDSYLYSYLHHTSNPKPKFGRLNSPGAWCSTDNNRYLIFYGVNLPQLAIVSRIAIQGGKDIYQKSNNYWITSYRLKTSIDDGSMGFFTWYRDRAGRRTFKANNDSFTVFEDELPFAVPMRAARIYPWTHENWICLRVEFYGVYLPRSACALSGPELPKTKPCTGDRNCGKNANCQPKNSGIIKQKVGDLWRTLYSNDSAKEYCTCHPGYHGASCQHYGCTINPCQNQGTCTEQLQDGAFKLCSCPPGFFGTFCQESCPAGHYGYNCSQLCQCNERGSCDQVTGKCHCSLGYNGTNCQNKCPTGFYGYNCQQRCQCQNGALCDHVTGACNCTLGWSGQFCDQRCPWNTWGDGCSRNCSCSSSSLMCDLRSGECLCDRGSYGRYCENKCPAGTYGWNCSQTCQCAPNSFCSEKDGSCNCTQPGLTGVLCKQPCRHGFYGIDCQEKCLCTNRADCDRVTGKCFCQNGWKGQLCDIPCPKGSWGHNCSFNCSCVNGAECDTVTGQCSCKNAARCVCHPGWAGPDCSVSCSEYQWGINCSKSCLCKNGAFCDPVNGTCSCPAGFHGTHCDKPCSSGFYGSNCLSPCGCNSSTSNSCDPKTGACRCLPGWQGVKCDIPCNQGSWGANCNQSCVCVHGSCDPVIGSCRCNRGWMGKLCNHTCSNCNTPCPKCYHSNLKCDTSSGKCHCYAGYHGDACLESCPPGYYGQGCQHKCRCVHGLCRPDSGSCDCKPGWTGVTCNKPCSIGTFGYNCSQACSSTNGICNPQNGSYSCPSGYHGSMCRRACPKGWYGSGCGHRCNCSDSALCDHVTGQCSCASGWMGNRCDTVCSPGYYGVNCLAKCTCKVCEPVTGACSCPAGLQGLSCTQPCPSGYYGNRCSEDCHCANEGTCNHVDGKCTCKAGWMGAQCTKPCPVGRFGMSCSSSCNCDLNGTENSRPCHHITGTCNCKPGFQGLRCQEQCKLGYYGKNCLQKCHCLNNGVCDVSDGACICSPGYHGKVCEKTCANGFYGVRCNSTCGCISSNTRVCNKVDGFCSCLHGYLGVLCENRCPQGSYGYGCHGNCSCKNGAHCDHRTGQCTCTDGYKGRNCTEICDEGTFGPGCTRKCLCENGAKCNRFTGECICTAGYEGQRCSDTCLEGRYGADCVEICDCNPSHTKKCDHKHGTCHCMPGYTHHRCDQECKDGFYGQDCKKYCPACSRHVSGACNKQYGNCTCTAGYHGYQCYDDCPLNSFGLQCREKCSCHKSLLCHHVYGSCLEYIHGLFPIVVMETRDIFNNVDSLRDLRIGIEDIMFKYFDQYSRLLDGSSVLNQVKQSTKTKARPLEALADNPVNRTQSTPKPTVASAAKHDFVVRIISIDTVLVSIDEEATRVMCVLLDNDTVVNSTSVLMLLKRIPNSEISTEIAARYYTGKLYTPHKPSMVKVHLPLIIGVSIGILLVMSILVMFMLRYSHIIKGGYPGYKKNKKDEAEFELQPCLSHGGSHLLAFDNPYYDVLAAMGIDDDIEEEYSNPLYDDVSLCSDSYTSSTDDTCNKDLAHIITS